MTTTGKPITLEDIQMFFVEFATQIEIPIDLANCSIEYDDCRPAAIAEQQKKAEAERLHNRALVEMLH